jgi:quercetin dioxygenase-like cupin family protein
MDLIDLDPKAELADPGDGGRVVIQVLSGRVTMLSGEDATSYGNGTLVALEPGEAGAMQALEQSRLLLTISPRPAPHGHSPGSA